MRHQLSGRQLSRNSSHRKALMRNMCVALIRAETIRTTLPKAKELRRVVEPLITLGKTDTLPGRRRAWITLRDDALVEKRRSVPPKGATSTLPATLTKWIEISPASIACSA